jgi:hypothetical protein
MISRTAVEREVFQILPLESRVLLSLIGTGSYDLLLPHPTLRLEHPIPAPLAPGQPAAVGSSVPSGLIPAQVRGAYGVNNIRFGGTLGTGAGVTIAIVDAFDNPNIQGDLATFDAAFGLPAPPSFQVLNQSGQATPLPPVDMTGNWEIEEALDVEWVHAMAPQASLILFEADNPGTLFTAEDTARRFAGVSVISNSWGGPESPTDIFNDFIFTTPSGHIPVTFLAAAGDSGAFGSDGSTTITPDYPASSPNVVSVGGTALTVDTNNNYVNETGWGNGDQSGLLGGGGGGISGIESQPAYQARFVSAFSTTNRTYPDVAALADPATGAAVYDSTTLGAGTGWVPGGVGGTSLACPLWAGFVGIANQGRLAENNLTLDGQEVLTRLYQLPGEDYHDITSGNNGFAAGTGYDLVTGIGTPVTNLLVPDLCGPFLGNLVFNDRNVNGIQDDTAGGVPGAQVQLNTPGTDGIVGTADDVTIASTTTDATGGYSFSQMLPGLYYLHFIAPTGFQISPANQGVDATLDSNPDPATGNTPLIFVSSSTWDSTQDCGMFQKTISINDASITEGDSGLKNLVFTVTLAPVNPTGAAVTFSTSDGTTTGFAATVADNDYHATSGTLIFAAGVLSQTISVPIVGDTKIENDETFTVHISTPAGFVALKSAGTGTIINDDFPSATVTSFTATRPDTGTIDFPFTITLTGDFGGATGAPFAVQVPFATQDFTAVELFDFVRNAGTLTFAPGTTTQTIDVTVLGGTTPTLDKVFFLNLSASPTVKLGNPSKGTGTIISNSPPAVGVADAQATESLTGLGTLAFNVTVAPSLTGTVNVDFTTTDGTAIAGTDYLPASGTLTFTPGRIAQTVFVPVLRRFLSPEDGLDKTLTLNLSNITGTGTLPIFSKATATGTIHDIAAVNVPFNAAKHASYTDYLNHRISVQLIGPGTGSVVFLGESSTATDAYEILLDGTTPASNLLVRTSGGQTTFTNVIITGSLGGLSAPTSNLVGQVSATGSINRLAMNFVQAGTMNIGAGAGALAITLGRALDTSITSAIPISLISASAYLNTDNVPDLITAPSVGTVRVKGTFGGTIVTENVAAVVVGGSIQGASILASNKVGVVAALNGISDSTIFAGVRDGLTTLPTTADDFVNKSATIGRVFVRSGGFSNSMVAGWHVGYMSLGSVQTADNGSTFGVIADRVAAVNAVSAFTDAPIRAIGIDDPTKSVITANFVVKSI